jgi:hypothetical protein
MIVDDRIAAAQVRPQHRHRVVAAAGAHGD